MRLTLRTLLAYMDGLLDPKDSQEIGKKIEDSQYAKDLYHRIRDVMRRLRLGAPSLTERAANLDCNTVAEYLDNALPGDRVPDFEEVSLKSDMHLAEVASCHQILTMVLGEPVEINPESRQRMYQLPTVANRVDEERVAAAEAANMLSGDRNGPLPPVSQVKARPRPVVPEYLRDPPKKPRLLAAAIMLLVGAVVGLLVLTVYPEGAKWLQAKLHGKAEEEDRDAAVKKPVKPSEEGAAGANSAAGSGSATAASNDSGLPGTAKDSGTSLAATGSGAESMVPPLPTSTGPTSTIPTPTGAAPAVAGPGKGPLFSPGTPGPTGSAALAIGTSASGVVNPGASQKSPVVAIAGPNVKSTGGTTGAPAGGPTTARPAEEVAAMKPATPPDLGHASPRPRFEDKQKIGRFISGGQDVLLKLEANNTWRRVTPEDFIAAGQPLLALPSYRPRLAMLNVGATLELINGTRIELLPDNAQGQPGVDIDFGRVVIKPLAQAGARLRVVVGSHEGTIILTSVDSIAGLEVTRVHDAGTDPEKVFSHALTRLYVARGGAIWEEGESKPPVQLTAPAELTLDGAVADAPRGGAKESPKWITANTVNELDQRAAISVSQALSPQRAASLGLMELTEARQIEIRWLAARCLGYLGQFDPRQFNPLTAALNEPGFRREWPDYIDQLEEAIARGPETAASIRQSLDGQYGNESAALYRMLWGYTDKQLEDGEDARLVKFLDHELPVFRVLAFWNLNNITHQGLYYRPDDKAAKRLPSVQQWRKQQQLGRIRHSLPPLARSAEGGKARPGSSEPPSKAKLTPPPKPLDDVVPGEVNPASATEPIAPQPDALGNPLSRPSGAPNRADRLPIVVPEPNPAEKRPPIAIPEP